MGQQYLRRFRLIASDDSGNGYDLSSLRTVFKIDKKDSQTPANCVLSVYNAAESTRSRFIRGQFTQIYVEAGYGNYITKIFSGNIKDKRLGTENSVDIYVEVLAGDADLALNFGVVSTTLAAGSTPNDHIEACYSSLAPYGVSKGQIDDVSDYFLPRGKTMFGSTKDYLREIGLSNGMSLSIQDSALQGLKKKSYLEEGIIVLTNVTGMIGAPVLTAEGVNVKMLLNPQIKIGSRVKINQKDITKEAFSTDAQDTSTATDATHKIAADGLYRVIALAHSGDTRGSEWYTTIVAIAMDESLPLGEQAYAG